MAKTQMPRVVGPMLGYYSDIGSQLLYPERARIEALQYRCRIGPDGSITFSSPAVTMLSDYNFALRKIIGFAVGADSLGNAAGLIDFNVVEQGRSFSVFKRAISFAAAIVSPLEWEGAYISVPGTTLDVTWSVDTARWPSFVGNQREVGVQLIGELVSTGQVG